MKNVIRRIALASDHAGYRYKEHLKHFLQGKGYEVFDAGTYSEERADYPDYGEKAARKVADNEADAGVLVCGSGIGISIAANKVPGIRAANCTSVEMATLARQHNNANVVAVGQRLISATEAEQIVEAFLTTEFEGGRHEERVKKIHNIEQQARND